VGIKELIVVGGPNGAGKTTFAEDYVASFDSRYIGADAIAAELSPLNPAKAQIAASREFIRRLEEAIRGEGQFVVESTLSGRTLARLLERAKNAGFEITVLYLFIDSVEISLDRVRARVERGGHDVPEIDVRRRFVRSMRNFWHLYRPLADHWVLTYNSGTHPEEFAVGTTIEETILDTDLFSRFEQLL
jgi:predicted ABC-type ATPase